MKFRNPGAEFFIPDGKPEAETLRRVTHMGIGAHQDDLEILAVDGILKCFGSPTQGFLGVVVTSGSGSPREGPYADTTDAEMQAVRRNEQKKAAVVGEYAGVVLLNHPSSALKDKANAGPVEDLKTLLAATKPRVVYTHNPADKHDTHVAVMLRVLQAIRALAPGERPEALFGCEVWRDLDWLSDADKMVFDVSARENLTTALVGIFDSQVAGGKRYDLATIGRRRAHATYFASHGVDTATQLVFGMDLTPLVKNETLDVTAFLNGYIERFAKEVRERIGKLA
ncbi:MAG: PIG-L family deacetylase [Planctomycetota bacterium]